MAGGVNITDNRAIPDSGGPTAGLRAIFFELRRVVWPTRRELIRMTGVVVATVIVIGTFISGIDALLNQVTKVVYGGT